MRHRETILTETLLSAQEAVREPVLRGKRAAAHVSKFYRMVSAGAKGIDGRRVRLESVRLPGGIYTSREAIARFVAALNQPEGVAESMPPETMQAGVDAALDRAGL